MAICQGPFPFDGALFAAPAACYERWHFLRHLQYAVALDTVSKREPFLGVDAAVAQIEVLQGRVGCKGLHDSFSIALLINVFTY